jgi:hypothetical protein
MLAKELPPMRERSGGSITIVLSGLHMKVRSRVLVYARSDGRPEQRIDHCCDTFILFLLRSSKEPQSVCLRPYVSFLVS